MGLSLLGFLLVQALALWVARGGGARQLRDALAAAGDVAGRSEAQMFDLLGAPARLRIASAADDVFAAPAVSVADWVETGPRGGWHVAMGFVGDRCLGISACNFQPATGAGEPA
jgi:predicted deacylase